jgi:hydrogenase maturation factor
MSKTQLLADKIATELVANKLTWEQAQEVTKSINYLYKHKMVIPLMKSGLNDNQISIKTKIAPSSVGIITTEYYNQNKKSL